MLVSRIPSSYLICTLEPSWPNLVALALPTFLDPEHPVFLGIILCLLIVYSRNTMDYFPAKIIKMADSKMDASQACCSGLIGNPGLRVLKMRYYLNFIHGFQCPEQ